MRYLTSHCARSWFKSHFPGVGGSAVSRDSSGQSDTHNLWNASSALQGLSIPSAPHTQLKESLTREREKVREQRFHVVHVLNTGSKVWGAKLCCSAGRWGHGHALLLLLCLQGARRWEKQIQRWEKQIQSWEKQIPEPPSGQGSVVKGSAICPVVGDTVSALCHSQIAGCREHSENIAARLYLCAVGSHTGWISSALQGCSVCCSQHVSSAWKAAAVANPHGEKSPQTKKRCLGLLLGWGSCPFPPKFPPNSLRYELMWSLHTPGVCLAASSHTTKRWENVFHCQNYTLLIQLSFLVPETLLWMH